MLLIRWGYFPTEVREAFRPILLRYLWLVPTWCHKLYVQYEQPHDGSDTDVSAHCFASPEYRTATITLCSPWIDGSPAKRDIDVLHEILHIPLAPLQLEYESQMKRLVPDDEAPKFRATLLEQNLHRLEGTVQDLAAAVSQLDPKKLPAVSFREDEDEHPAPRRA